MRLSYSIAIIVMIALLDQASKIWIEEAFTLGEQLPVIDGFFHLILIYNTGISFGFAQNMPLWLLVIGTCLITVLLFYWLVRETIIGAQIGLAFAIGGGIGNIIDRYRTDGVVDFLLFYYQDFYYPAFNLADTAITCGAILLAYCWLKKPS
jgi:signal peptidase II